MTGFHGEVERCFIVVAFDGQVCAAVEQDADHFLITVLRRGVERGVATLFTDVRVGSEFEEHLHDLVMSASRRGLNGRGFESVMRLGVDRRARLDEIFRRIEMTEETSQPQWLESIFGIGIDEFGITRQQTYDIVDLAGRSGFEDVDGNGLVRKEGRNLRLVVIGGDQDRAESILFEMDQARVQVEAAFHLFLISLFDRVEKFLVHDDLQ